MLLVGVFVFNAFFPTPFLFYKDVLNNWIVESTLLLLSLKNIFIFFLTIISLLIYALLWDYV